MHRFCFYQKDGLNQFTNEDNFRNEFSDNLKKIPL